MPNVPTPAEQAEFRRQLIFRKAHDHIKSATATAVFMKTITRAERDALLPLEILLPEPGDYVSREDWDMSLRTAFMAGCVETLVHLPK